LFAIPRADYAPEGEDDGGTADALNYSTESESSSDDLSDESSVSSKAHSEAPASTDEDILSDDNALLSPPDDSGFTDADAWDNITTYGVSQAREGRSEQPPNIALAASVKITAWRMGVQLYLPITVQELERDAIRWQTHADRLSPPLLHFDNMAGLIPGISTLSVRLGEDECLEVLDRSLNTLHALPKFYFLRNPRYLEDTIDTLQHVAKFKYLHQLDNESIEPAARDFKDSFFIKLGLAVHLPDPTGVFMVEHGQKFVLDIQNYGKDPLYIRILEFTPNWQIIEKYDSGMNLKRLETGSAASCRFTFTMSVPNFPGAHRQSWSSTIKVIVTNEPTSVPQFKLPPPPPPLQRHLQAIKWAGTGGTCATLDHHVNSALPHAVYMRPLRRESHQWASKVFPLSVATREVMTKRARERGEEIFELPQVREEQEQPSMPGGPYMPQHVNTNVNTKGARASPTTTSTSIPGALPPSTHSMTEPAALPRIPLTERTPGKSGVDNVGSLRRKFSFEN